MERRVHIVVNGLVQGVGFRYFTFRKAKELGLTGFVKNLPDGTVEVEAEGEQGMLQELIDAIKIGPRSAVVNEVNTDWNTFTGEYDQFRVQY